MTGGGPAGSMPRSRPGPPSSRMMPARALAHENAIQPNRTINSARTMPSSTVSPPTSSTRYIWKPAAAVIAIVAPKMTARRRGRSAGGEDDAAGSPAPARQATARRATPAVASAAATRAEGSEAAPHPAVRARALALRRPSIDPYLRQRFVTLHQLRAQLDHALLRGREAEADAPAVDRRIGLDHDIADLALVGRRIDAGRLDFQSFEIGADEVEHEQPAIVRGAADRGLDHPRERVTVRPVAAPVQAIGEAVFAFQRLLRPPECDDVVVNLLLGRDLDQLHGAVAPIADRLDPQARALLVARLEILIGPKIVLALQESEAARIGVREGRDLQVTRVVERAPQLLAPAVADREAVRVVDGRPIVVDVQAIVEVEEEHAGERRKARMGDVAPWIERNLGVEDRRLAGPDGEAIGAGQAFRVEQGVDDDRIGVGRRLLDPEALEEGKFLPLRIRRIDREAARRKAVDLALGDSAKIGCAEKHAHLVVIVGSVHRRMQPKAGKAEIRIRWRRLDLAEVEQARRVADRNGASLDDLEDVDAVRVVEAAVEELGLEGEALLSPQRAVGQEPNRTIAVVVEVLERVRKLVVRRLVRLLRQVARELPHQRGAERRRITGRPRLRVGHGDAPARSHKKRQSGRHEELASIQGGVLRV